MGFHKCFISQGGKYFFFQFQEQKVTYEGKKKKTTFYNVALGAFHLVKREVTFLEQPPHIHHKWTSPQQMKSAEKFPVHVEQRGCQFPWAQFQFSGVGNYRRQSENWGSRSAALRRGGGEALEDWGPRQRVALSRHRTRSQ